ncbi:hypothetical protein SAMN05421827_109113 [Pedobacter terrae]|uniref:Uncharacterized protein n=1 Tax=Pedobacter terrae TaxID=405671 RepID=A0A1G7W5W0_9SPHI|nr:hypothetical protein [Pedobacter terrae]SDG67357.1 hypothetical protein SAMN05421827_109113 [Pedobacter terrae]
MSTYKLDYYKTKYPDAVQYLERTQAFVSEDEARKIAYKGEDTQAKCLFKVLIPSTHKSTQQYIFSEQALKDELKELNRRQVHDEQLMERYH